MNRLLLQIWLIYVRLTELKTEHFSLYMQVNTTVILNLRNILKVQWIRLSKIVEVI